MLKNKTNITAEKNITILNNDTEYNELHRECFGSDKTELLTSVFSVSDKEPLWWCELQHYFPKQEEGFG